MSDKVVERNSNIELLRIVAMFMIVVFHACVHSGLTFTSFTLNKFIVKIFNMFGELGVNSFMLITGYFMINRKFDIKKLILLISEIFFYNFLSNLIIHRECIFYGIFNSLYPIIKGIYWFVTVYVLIYILSPYYNRFIKSMNHKELKKIIITALILWSIIPTIYGVFINNTEEILFYNRFIWLSIVYFIGAYIRLYGLAYIKNKKDVLKYIVLISIFIIFSIIIIETFSEFFLNIGIYDSAYFWYPNTVPMIILSISTFEYFLNMDMSYNKLINKLSRHMFGVYLLHDGLLSKKIWKIGNLVNFTNEKTYIFFGKIFLVSIIIFCVGIIVDIFRSYIEKYLVSRFLHIESINYNIKKINENLNIL